MIFYLKSLLKLIDKKSLLSSKNYKYTQPIGTLPPVARASASNGRSHQRFARIITSWQHPNSIVLSYIVLTNGWRQVFECQFIIVLKDTQYVIWLRLCSDFHTNNYFYACESCLLLCLLQWQTYRISQKYHFVRIKWSKVRLVLPTVLFVPLASLEVWVATPGA